MSIEKFKNVIIYDGVTEFTINEILDKKELTFLMNSVINLGGFMPLIDKINSEKGIIYINTDLSYDSGSGDLRNVSNELYSEFEKRKP